MIFDYKLTMNTETVPILIMLHGIWYSTPFAMITLFAGLQSLPQEPMEAATVDGASTLQKIWYVVLPHLRSLFVFIALIGIMDAYRVFDSIYVLTKQNPLFKADTIMYYNFKVALSFRPTRQGQRHGHADRDRDFRGADPLPDHDLPAANGGALMERVKNPSQSDPAYRGPL